MDESTSDSHHTGKEDLASAMRERRDDLRLSQQAAADLSKELDLAHLRDHGFNIGGREGDGPRTFSGVSLKTWTNLEQCKSDHPYPHTLRMVDDVLGWTPGTAQALFHLEPLPDDPPPADHDRPDECTEALEEAAVRESTLRQEARDLRIAVYERDREIAELRLELARLA